MRRFVSPLSMLLLVAAVGLLPACKKDSPPAPAPTESEAAPAPADAPAEEPAAPAAGEWEEAAAPPGESFLSPEEINARELLKTVYFDTNRSDIRPDQRATMQANAAWLREHPDVRILIEGHADERNTREYNLALGDRRAQAAKGYLVSLGIDTSRIETISYGEEQPVAMGSDESAWQLNRRVEFVAVEAGAGGSDR